MFLALTEQVAIRERPLVQGYAPHPMIDPHISITLDEAKEILVVHAAQECADSVPTPDTTLRDYYTREEIKAHMQGRVGKIPEAVLGIIGDLEVTEAALNRLAEVAREWLAETDAADADDPLIHDFYVRVGSVWGHGNFYRRFKEALGDD